MVICVFGAAAPNIDEIYIKKVEQLGEEMANRGHDLIFGAGTHGLMGAAARGFKKGGGKITGVIPNFFKEETIEVIYTECDEIIYTQTMRERKQTMEDGCDAFVIVPGGIGTFEEFYEVLTLKQLGRHSKPIAIYNIDGFYDDMMNAMEKAAQKGFIRESCRQIYYCSDNLEDIIDYVENSRPVKLSLRDLKEG